MRCYWSVRRRSSQRSKVHARQLAEALFQKVEQLLLAVAVAESADVCVKRDGNRAHAFEFAFVAGLSGGCAEHCGFVANAAEGPDALGSASVIAHRLGGFEGEFDFGHADFHGGVEVVPIADGLHGGAATGAAQLSPAGARASTEHRGKTEQNPSNQSRSWASDALRINTALYVRARVGRLMEIVVGSHRQSPFWP
jgi:hypothetical protein